MLGNRIGKSAIRLVLLASFLTGTSIPVGFTVGESVIDVLTVGAGVREPLETLWALKRFLSGMKSLVLGQVVLMFESLVAVGTFVRPLICIRK